MVRCLEVPDLWGQQHHASGGWNLASMHVGIIMGPVSSAASREDLTSPEEKKTPRSQTPVCHFLPGI